MRCNSSSRRRGMRWCRRRAKQRSRASSRPQPMRARSASASSRPRLLAPAEWLLIVAIRNVGTIAPSNCCKSSSLMSVLPKDCNGGSAMTCLRYICATLVVAVPLLAGSTAPAADVTSDRLINADREPHNWLTNHRTYDAQRYSPLDRINKDNVSKLKLAYAVAIGGTAA